MQKEPYPNVALGRYCELHAQRESTVEELTAGLDYREPRHRRASFLRFYQFHLRYRAHPGCVYYLMPWIAGENQWSREERLWYAFINGNTQNPATSWILFKNCRPPEWTEDYKYERLEKFFNENWRRLEFDMDRRYHKKRFVQAARNYARETCSAGGQRNFWNHHGADWKANWKTVSQKFAGFGRLSSWSYLEYLHINGHPAQPENLMLDDKAGSRSHRNGLCKVLGRDDLDWHESNPAFNGRYTDYQLDWLDQEASILLKEARELCEKDNREKRAVNPVDDINYFTLESALCTYKSWYRPNRRYPNVYNDMLHDRIRAAEANWPEEDFGQFWQARQDILPAHLRLEDNPNDPGLAPLKQNHFRESGTPVMMSKDWKCFENEFDSFIWRAN